MSQPSVSHSPIRKILRINASGRREGSVSRRFGDQLQAGLLARHPGAEVISRDLGAELPFVDEAWIGANFTDPAERSAEQRQTLALSDQLAQEVIDADALILCVPIYNFSVPAAMKAWIDMICRARLTFRYTDSGVEGLAGDKPAFVVIASGGVPLGSPMDFASGYLRQVLNFIGIHDVRMIAADQLNIDADAAQKRAGEQIEQTLAA